jgi:hypothetical protein
MVEFLYEILPGYIEHSVFVVFVQFEQHAIFLSWVNLVPYWVFVVPIELRLLSPPRVSDLHQSHCLSVLESGLINSQLAQ